MAGKMNVQIKNSKKHRKCTVKKKEYGDLLENFDSLKKLPTFANILGYYHYLSKMKLT